MKVYIRCEDDFDSDLAFTGDSGDRANVAYTTDSSELLEIYVTDPAMSVRYNALANPHISTELLSDIVSDIDFSNLSWLDCQYLSAIAKNPAVSEELLQQIVSALGIQANSNNAYLILLKFLENPNISSDILVTLAESETSDSTVLQHIGSNPNTPDYILEILLKRGFIEREGISRNPRAPHNIFMVLVNDRDVSVRAGVARNPHTSADILAILAKDKKSEVRRAVAGNRHTPRDILKQLVKDSNRQVVNEAASNPSIR